jgi:predicted nucleic acid-binding protein
VKKLPNVKAVEWLRDNEREIAVDPIILGELRFGILLLRNGRRRTSLERWVRRGRAEASLSALGGGDGLEMGAAARKSSRRRARYAD